MHTALATKKELKNLARNVGLTLQDRDNSLTSLAICFDALTTVLDQFMTTKEWKLNGEPKLFSDYLKEELEKRKQMSLPKPKPEEKPAEEKEADANPASDK